MGDSEFDSFFEDAPAGDAPAPATDDAFAAPADAAPAMPADGGFDFGGDAGAPAFDSAPAPDTGMGGMGNDMADMSSAFVTSANLTESPALSEWRAANRKKIEERQAASKVELDKVLAQAEVDRKNFYDQRTKQIDATKKSNREQEAAMKEALETNAVKDNLWESVVELVDLQSKDGATDIARMRQTMLAMKNE